MALAVSLRAQKRTLRKAVSDTLRIIPASILEEQCNAKAITKRVLSIPAFEHAKTISCYLNMPSGEVNTSYLVDEIFEKGKNLFVPRIIPAENHMDFLKVYGKDDLASFPAGKWGIREPDTNWQGQERENAFARECDVLDVILVPGVAFDRSLSRLGHGKGYYDRFLTTYTSAGRPKPLLVALALREQVLDEQEVPMADHDWKVDFVVTPDEIFKP